MYNVGDMVVIRLGNNKVYSEGCPLENLDGTIAKIECVYRGVTNNTYDLRFIHVVAKDYNSYEEYQQHMAWTDDHLVPYEENEIELNTLELFI